MLKRFLRKHFLLAASSLCVSSLVCAVSLAQATAETGIVRAKSTKAAVVSSSSYAGAARNQSAGGYWARLAATGRLDAILNSVRQRTRYIPAPNPLDEGDEPFIDPDNGIAIAGGQAEYSVAVDSTGQHIVIGYNDTRGFSLSPVTLSGVITSSDGGVTFVDRGQLPATATTQVFGDPDVKYVPGGAGCQFIYSSILVNVNANPALSVQTMSLHRSTDCGVTWQGPFEVTPATISPANGADKEFIDVDPETGRVLMGWTNFAPAAQEISATFSDNVFAATPPTWSARAIIESTNNGPQSAIPRFAGNGSANAYMAWTVRVGVASAPIDGSPYNSIHFSRSTDNGATWGTPINISSGEFYPADQVPGNDRIHSFPGMAVDTTAGARSGNIYVAYADNNSQDGSDIAFVKSIDGGLTFSPPVHINANPGGDRSQWFPAVTVDNNGRVAVSYYDQAAASSGDLTEQAWVYSDDGGATWSKPSPLTDRPFHGGYGNDTGQPNLGDYVGATTNSGQIYAVWAGATQGVGFADGQPSGSMTLPDMYFKKTNTQRAAVRLGAVTYADSNANGNIDPGELVTLTIPLTNYVNNAVIGNITYTGVSGTLALPAPIAGVSITTAASVYANIGSLATVNNSTPLVLTLAPTFVAGTPIELTLTVTTAQGVSTVLPFTLKTGTPVSTTLLSEDFNGVAAGSLPAGWSSVHQGGSGTVAWTTSSTFCATASNALFHTNNATGARWERAFSPVVTMPSTFGYATVDFDICYDTEDDPDFNVQAYDGLTLRLADQTGGARIVRSVLAEAFADSIVTTPGSTQHFPKHLPRWTNSAYLEDMSVWAGDSGGWKHVTMRLPVTGGLESGSAFQLRWEYTQDSGGICSDVRPGHTCGVALDNIEIKGVSAAVTSVDVSVAGLTDAPDPVLAGNNVTYGITIANDGGTGSFVANDVTWTDVLPAGTTFVSLASPAGWICTTPAVGATGTVSCAQAIMPTGSAAFTLVAKASPATANGSTLTNTVSVATSTVDTSPANNSATTTTTVNAQADIGVSQAGPATVTPGSGAGNLVYVVTVTNAGPSNAAAVTMGDSTNSGLTATVSGACASLPCNLGTVAPGASAVVNVTYTVPAGYTTPNPITNTATVSTTTNQNGATANDINMASTNVTTQADVSVTQSGPSSVLRGTNLAYVLTVSNAGPSNAAAVVLTDTTNSGLAPTVSGACASVPCNLGSMAPGASVQVTVTYAIPPNYSSAIPITNTANVSTTTNEAGATANNTDTASTNLIAVTTISGPAGGLGNASVTLSGGGANCSFSSDSQWIPLTGDPHSPPAGSAPAGYRFPFGLLDFRALSCAPGATVHFVITLPGSIGPIEHPVYYKYGPTPTDATYHWYALPATISGNTVSFDIKDGALGDDDLSPNGNIADVGGPAVTEIVIPTLSRELLLMLGAFLALMGWGVMRARSPRR